MQLSDLIEVCRTRIEKLLDNYITNCAHFTPTLRKSMAYGVFNGGKKLRPLLVYAVTEALGGQLKNADAPAAALELIHSYSLIHDDLPAMDNADLRRGKPACHKVFGDAMAILAGDALQSLAFQVIADHPNTLTPSQRLKMTSILAHASGAAGMAGGQALDLQNQIGNLTDLVRLHQLKTGALLSASAKLGVAAVLETDHSAIESYAHDLGLAFQIQDDLLDIEGDTATLGKPQGLDIINKKITFPHMIGVEKSRQKIVELTESALAAIEDFKEQGAILRELAEYLLQRKS